MSSYRAFEFRDTCAICDAPLAFGSYHCEQCVKNDRVCTMCDTSIAEKSKRAIYCCDSCKTRASEKRKEFPSDDRKLTVTSPGIDAEELRTILAETTVTKDDLIELDHRNKERQQRLESALQSPPRTDIDYDLLADKVVAKLQQAGMVDPLIGPANRSVDLQTEMRDFMREIRDELRQHPTATAPSYTMQQASPRNMSDDDLLDNLEITEAEYDPENNNPAFNFVLSMAAIAGTDIPDEVREYAERTGRLKSSGPRKMDVPDIAPPSEDAFDDLDIEITRDESM